MAKRKTYPVVQLAHWMVKRDGPRCECWDQTHDVSWVCRDCWGTGFSGGYTLHAASVGYYLVKDNTAPKESEDTWATRVYRPTHQFDPTNYALGDILVDLTSPARWKIIAASVAGEIETRLVQPYETAQRFPTL
jgi:hypothetical protein